MPIIHSLGLLRDIHPYPFHGPHLGDVRGSLPPAEHTPPQDNTTKRGGGSRGPCPATFSHCSILFFLEAALEMYDFVNNCLEFVSRLFQTKIRAVQKVALTDWKKKCFASIFDVSSCKISAGDGNTTCSSV